MLPFALDLPLLSIFYPVLSLWAFKNFFFFSIKMCLNLPNNFVEVVLHWILKLLTNRALESKYSYKLAYKFQVIIPQSVLCFQKWRSFALYWIRFSQSFSTFGHDVFTIYETNETIEFSTSMISLSLIFTSAD